LKTSNPTKKNKHGHLLLTLLKCLLNNGKISNLPAQTGGDYGTALGAAGAHGTPGQAAQVHHGQNQQHQNY